MRWTAISVGLVISTEYNHSWPWDGLVPYSYSHGAFVYLRDDKGLKLNSIDK